MEKYYATETPISEDALAKKYMESGDLGLKKRAKEISKQEDEKETPESLKNLGKFIKNFKFVPGEKPIISSIFEGRRKKETIDTKMKFISTAPVMEALSLRLQQLYTEAFDEKGEMLNYDRVLDIHGILVFLEDYYSSAEQAGNKINAERLRELEDALPDLAGFDDPYGE